MTSDWTEDMTDELVGHLRARIDGAPSAAPDVSEIASRGNLRRTRRRAVTSVMASVLAIVAIVGVGLGVRTTPEQELAASLNGDAPIPFAVEVRDDGSLVGLALFHLPGELEERVTARTAPQADEIALVESTDGLEWSLVEGSVFDLTGTSAVGRPQALGFALRDTTAVLATTTLVAQTDGQPQEPSLVSLVTAEFDLDASGHQATWQRSTTELDVALDPDESVIAVEVGAAARGVLVNVTAFADLVAARLEDAGDDLRPICGAASPSSTQVVVRRCGSTELEKLDVLSAPATPRTFSAFVGTDGVSELRPLSVSLWWEHQVYQTTDGVGLVTDGFGETTDGQVWTVPWEAIGTVGGVAADGERRIAFERHVPAPLGPGRSFRGLWISDSAAVNEVRSHRVVAGESGTHIAADYGIELDDLVAANPTIDPDAFGDTTALEPGVELVIPDVDPMRRGWRSIDLRPAIGSLAMTSQWMFDQVAAGPGGFVVSMREISTQPIKGETLLDTRPFRVDGPNGSIEGSTPFGPATVRDLEGRIVAEWDHLEVANPSEIVSAVRRPEGPMVEIDVGGSSDMVFPADEWHDAIDWPGAPTTILFGSVDGVEWRELGRYHLAWLEAVDESAVYVSTWFGEVERVEIGEPAE